MKEIIYSLGDDDSSIELSVAEVKAQGLNHWYGWDCTVGMNSLYIDFDGRVWRGPCRVGGPIGHIRVGDWVIPRQMVKCTRRTCDCGTGIKLLKMNFPKTVVPMQPQAFQVQWDLGRRCNFDCSYCWPDSHNKTDEWVPFPVMEKTIDRVFEQVQHSQIQFNFAGGEPTLHPNFTLVCTHIRSRGGHTHIQTNGTMSLDRARILARLAEISISVHFEQANPEKLCRNIEAILGQWGKLEVKMMVTPDSFQKMHDFKERLSRIPCISRARVIVSPLRDPVTNHLMDYTDEQKEEFGDVHF